MANIIGHVWAQGYNNGKYRHGIFKPGAETHIMTVPLFTGFLVGRAANELEAEAVSGPGFVPYMAFHKDKLVIPGEAGGRISREHCKISLEYPEPYGEGCIQATEEGLRAVSIGADIWNLFENIKLQYRHLSKNGAPTTVLRKGDEPRLITELDDIVEFSMDDLRDPAYFLIGFGLRDTDPQALKKGHNIVRPVIKVWYEK